MTFKITGIEGIVVETMENGEHLLSDYPAPYVADLLNHFEDDEEGDIERVVSSLEEDEYTPGYCPERFADFRGYTFVNGFLASDRYLGKVEYKMEVWTDAIQADVVSRPDEELSNGSRFMKRFYWLRDNCKGAWFLHSSPTNRYDEDAYNVWVSFAETTDEFNFLLKFPEN